MTTTATTTKTKLLTAHDLMRLSSKGVRGELIRGVLHKTMASGVNHGTIVVKLVLLLGAFIIPNRLGKLMASDVGIWLERDPDTVREPDIAFISAARMPIDADVPGYSEIVPDLIVEVKSPSNSRRELREKAFMWLDYGAALVWAVLPEDRAVDVYYPDGSVVTLTADDALDGGEALPGFSCRVSEIFDA